jgi:nucleotide-binding universal stress UspA family protein
MTTIVVGVDGSPSSENALRWACGEASLHSGAQIIAVSVGLAPSATSGPTKMLADAVASVAGESDLHIVQRAVPGVTWEALLEEATNADMVVVGRRGLGALKGRLLGSVSRQIVNHSRIPVVIVPWVEHVETPHKPTDPMVVGVDGSQNSVDALRWAATRARTVGCALRAAYVWGQRPYLDPRDDDFDWGLPAVADLIAAATAELDTYLTAAALPADVEIVPVLLEGARAAALIEESRSASLLVVGARSHRGLAELLLGSTATEIVHHAQCPVAIIRHDTAPRT